MHLVILPLCLLLLSPTLLQQCNCYNEVVYVSPTPHPNQDCPGQPCRTLQQYFSNMSFTQQSANLSMIFLTGQHTGECKWTGLKSISFTAIGVSEGVKIYCTNIEFSKATKMSLTNVTLNHCYISCSSSSALVLVMSSVIAQNSTQINIQHIECAETYANGNLIILENSLFQNHSSISGTLCFIGKRNKLAIYMNNSSLFFGKNTTIMLASNHTFHHYIVFLNFSTLDIDSFVHITFIDNILCLAMFDSTLNIMSNASMTFKNNSKMDDEGVAMFVVRSNLTIEGDLHFINNSAMSEAAINLQISYMNIIKNAKLIFVNNLAQIQAGAFLAGDSVINIEHNASVTFIINKSENKIGAMAMLKSALYMRHNTSIVFINNSAIKTGGAFFPEYSNVQLENNAKIMFINNSAENGGAMAIRSSTLNIGNNANMTFINNSALVEGGGIIIQNCSMIVESNARLIFINNSAPEQAGAFELIYSSLHLKNHATLKFINNSGFTGAGMGGALFSFASQIYIENSTEVTLTFMGNSARRGGAMALMASTYVLKNGESNMTFENNSAQEFGGAIYVDPDRLKIQSAEIQFGHCLYSAQSDLAQHNIFFINNDGEFAGNDVYGASLYSCDKTSVDVFQNCSISHSSDSLVSGDPIRVCICDKYKPQCHNTSYVRYVYPGETFSIPLVVVGGDWGITRGTVYATFNDSTSSTLKPHSQYYHWINTTQCTFLNYTVYSNPRQSAQLVLSVNSYSKPRFTSSDNKSTTENLYFTSVYIDLKFSPCPPGFSLQGNPQGCDCYYVLTDNGVQCEIYEGRSLFSWNTTLWINASSQNFIYSKRCPFNYCTYTKRVKDDPNVQCAFNRAGRLCGGCKENFSLAIGSSHCIYCQNNLHMSLFIFFAAAGFLLVIFISALNLTVTQGMVDGVIFYANIVSAYEATLFPETLHGELQFFKIFIAWLNLDFGIESCFIKGLNAFWKTWLQFVFPFYIWSIAGLMIVAARHSTRLTYLLGSRAVPVLATLVLLSYTKLLKSAVSALGFSIITVHYEQNVSYTGITWSADGTLDYFGYPHILLFIVALFILLFLWLSYTLTLLLIQWIRRISHLRLLKWITKFNPFYDAYFAHLKPKHQYWFGVLLLTRGAISISIASSFALHQSMGLLILLVSAGMLLFYTVLMNVYKSHAIHVLQVSVNLNLCFLSGFMIFVTHTKGANTSAMHLSVLGVSIGVVFLQFCAIILHQIYLMCQRYMRRGRVMEVQVNEEQSHAILDISTRYKKPKHSDETQPLLLPYQSDNDVPTY